LPCLVGSAAAGARHRQMRARASPQASARFQLAGSGFDRLPGRPGHVYSGSCVIGAPPARVFHASRQEAVMFTSGHTAAGVTVPDAKLAA
jgi:hypothetical protein